MKCSLKELVTVVVLALSPFFIFAGQISFDEFAKSGTGVALAGVVLGIYKVWKSGNTTCPNCGKKNKQCTCPE